MQCESCGKDIHDEEICAACDAILGKDYQPSHNYPEGIYFSKKKTSPFNKLCPACGVWFSSGNLIPTEQMSIAKHKPQAHDKNCPHCLTALRSKYAVGLNAASFLVLILVCSEFFQYTNMPYLYFVPLLIAAIALLYVAFNALREFLDERAYIIK